jgi:3'-phosphoadenosine 5'-phosphosulfate (PAPS) 3'-phosphatase
MILLPDRVTSSPWAERLDIAVDVVISAGAALMALRGRRHGAVESGGQLKTWVDRAAEGWTVGYLRAAFPHDAFLAEEDFDSGGAWDTPDAYWTVDALDGTRSYVEGFDGFCVQVAFIERGAVRLGVVYEPASRVCFIAAVDAGAYRQNADGPWTRLTLPHLDAWPAPLVYVDSTLPDGPVANVINQHRGEMLESGSIGVKICRVAEGKAHLFLKSLTFKLWDVAPGSIILSEAGAALSLWDGSPVSFDSGTVVYRDLVAAPSGLRERVVSELSLAASLPVPGTD